MKTAIKKAIHYLSCLLVLPLVVVFWLVAKSGHRDTMFSGMSQLLSLIPGKSGSYLRKAFYQFAMSHCHDDGFIGFGAIFSQADTEIHQGVYIGPQCNIGKCCIGRDCLFGSGVHVLSGKGQHRFDDLSTPVRDQGGTFEKIAIGEDTWVGNGAIIMANVGKHCVVAAGAVVTVDVADYAIVAGNPAKVVRSRSSSNGEVV